MTYVNMTPRPGVSQAELVALARSFPGARDDTPEGWSIRSLTLLDGEVFTPEQRLWTQVHRHLVDVQYDLGEDVDLLAAGEWLLLDELEQARIDSQRRGETEAAEEARQAALTSQMRDRSRLEADEREAARESRLRYNWLHDLLYIDQQNRAIENQLRHEMEDFHLRGPRHP